MAKQRPHVKRKAGAVRREVKKPEPAPIMVRVPVGLCKRIDRLRGLAPREAYIRQMLDQACRSIEEGSQKGRTVKK